MNGLQDILAQMKDRIVRYRESRAMNEENTKATLVEPILRAIGWDVENVDEVRREFKRKKSDKPVDYALLVLRTPRLFVEVKALGQNLSDRRWASQIMGYAAVAGVEWVVLTDGDEYRIYNSHATVAVEDKIFRIVKLSDDSSVAEETLSLLSKSQMTENRIETLWRAHFVDRQVRTVVEQLFSEDPPPAFIRLVGKHISNVPRKEIKASLSRAQIRLDFPIVPSLTFDKAKSPAAQRPKHLSKAESSPEVSLASLIQAGMLQPPLVLTKTYKGHDFTAQVEGDGKITFQGKTYDSLSMSAAMARHRVIGAPSGRKYPQTNGWTFWHFTDEDGKTKPMDVLRERYRERRGQVRTRNVKGKYEGEK